jgi:hypothetical protein
MATPVNYKTAIFPKSRGVSRDGEYSDCAVCAVSNATGLPYEKVHDVFKFYGRRDRKSTETRICIKAYLALGLFPLGTFGTTLSAKVESFIFENLGCAAPINPGISIKSFMKKYPTGRYVCVSSNHAFAIVDGALVDGVALLLNTRITSAYKVIS